jgi:hypothetical protein
MSKEQEGLIELVGQEYTKWFYDNAEPSVSGKPILNGEGILTRGEFINKIKTNPEFSERWGLKIEERELTWDESNKYYNNHQSLKVPYLGLKVPTKLITITYNDTKLESYE